MTQPAPLLTGQLRARRRGKAGRTWQCDGTYSTVHGAWCSLYRASDAVGHLVDSMLRERRDMDAARRFFASTLEVAGHRPEQVTTDGHDAYPRAIRAVLGEAVLHRCSQYLHNRIDQDHRGIKGRYSPLRGFGSSAGAARFCSAHDEVRDHVRHRARLHEVVPRGVQRERFRTRLAELRAMIEAA